MLIGIEHEPRVVSVADRRKTECFRLETHFDARLRAAHLYDRQLKERARAIEIYRDITTHETDPRRIQEAQKRLAELAPPAK